MHTLEQWLSVATRGLRDVDAARVRAEIGDHYQSALESARDEGLHAVEAERRALALLGDAKTANRQYRRVLLTKGEEFVLRAMMPPAHPNGLSKRRKIVGYAIVSLLLLEAMGAVVMLSYWAGTLGRLAAFAAVVILHEIVFRTIHVRSIRAGWVIRVVRWGVLAAGMTMLVGSGGPNRGITWGFLLAFAWFEYKRFVLRSKLPADQWPKSLYN